MASAGAAGITSGSGGRLRTSRSGIILVRPASTVLHSAMGTLVLDGEDAARFVDELRPLLDGERTRDEIAGCFDPSAHAALATLLDLFDRLGLTEIVSDDATEAAEAEAGAADDCRRHARATATAQERFFRVWTDRPEVMVRRLHEARVAIVGSEPWGDAFVRELTHSGVKHLDVIETRDALSALADGASADCQWELIVIAAHPDDIALHLQLARFAHEHGIPSLSGAIRGLEATIGPLVFPGQTACWNCCRLRLLANAPDQEAAHAIARVHAGRPAGLAPETGIRLAPATSAAGYLLALEALRFLSGYSSVPSHGRLVIQHLVTLEATTHVVLPLPWCAVCGPSPVTLRAGGDEHEDAPAAPWTNAATPEDLRRSLSGWIDARTGVISHVGLMPAEDDVPNFPFCAEAHVSCYTDGTYAPASRTICGGKGMTPMAAMIGAVGEAIERYSASRVRTADLLFAPIALVPGDVVDPRDLCAYDDDQYGRAGFPFARFDPSAAQYWVPGRWIDDGAPVWLPALSVYLASALGNVAPICQVTSNGLAAGVNVEDASMRAVCELIERHACMLTWLGRLPARRLIVDHPGRGVSPDIGYMIARIKQETSMEPELYLLPESPIPCVLCVVPGNGRTHPAVTVGAAANLDADAAVRGALLEAGYTLAYLCRAMTRGGHRIPESPGAVKTFRDHGLFYVPLERRAAFDFLCRPTDETPPPVFLSNLEPPRDRSLGACAGLLAASSCRVACVDVTSPDVARGSFRVVRAIGPHLQPIHCGHGLEPRGNATLAKRLPVGINPDPHPFT